MVAGRLVVYAVGERDVSADVLKALGLLEKDHKPTSRELADLVLHPSSGTPLNLTVGAGGREGNMEPLPMLAATIQYLRKQYGPEVQLSVLFVLTDQSDDDEVDQYHKDRDTFPFHDVLKSWGNTNRVKVLEPLVSTQPASRTYALDDLLGELSARVRKLEPEAVTVVVGPSTPAHHLTLTLLLADGLAGVRDVEYVELLETRPNPANRTIPPFTKVVPLEMPRLFDGPTTRQAALLRLRAFQPAQALDVASSFESAFDDEWLERLRKLVARIERHDSVGGSIAQVADLVDRLELGALSTAPPWQQLFELVVLIVEILPNAWLDRYSELQETGDRPQIPDNEKTIIQNRSGVSKGKGFEARLLLASAAPMIHRVHDDPKEFVTPHEQDRFQGEESRSLLWQAWWKELKQLRNDLAHTYFAVDNTAVGDGLAAAKVSTETWVERVCKPVDKEDLEEIETQTGRLNQALRFLEKGEEDSPKLEWKTIATNVSKLKDRSEELRQAELDEIADRIDDFDELKPGKRRAGFETLKEPAVVAAVASGAPFSALYVVGLMASGPMRGKYKACIEGSQAALWFRALTAPGSYLCLTDQRGCAESVKEEALSINEHGLSPDPLNSGGHVSSSPLRKTMLQFLRAEEPETLLGNTNPLIDECVGLADQLQNPTGRAVTAP
jgi:hypothetical protein